MVRLHAMRVCEVRTCGGCVGDACVMCGCCVWGGRRYVRLCRQV